MCVRISNEFTKCYIVDFVDSIEIQSYMQNLINSILLLARKSDDHHYLAPFPIRMPTIL